MPEPVVLGVDLGTTATKVVAWDARGGDHGSAKAGNALEEPQPGQAVEDPDAILAGVLDAVRDAAARARDAGCEVAGISFSSAMHSLIALDGDGRPLTGAVTWADTRATEQAERLRADGRGLALHRRTGTPVHPMSPLVKLMWFREREPELFAAARRWVGIKEHVLAHLTGSAPMDHSIASGTGLMDLSRLAWDPEALDLAGVGADRLPELVPTTQVVPGLAAEAARRTGLPRGTPVVAGAGDGPLANLGMGAVDPGVAACSIGTSGALRVTTAEPAVDQHGRVFCYALTPGRWVVGGAITNGGVVLEWAGHALAPDLGDGAADRLLALAEEVPAGSGGLLMLPYLFGERAPHWSSLPRGAYVGLTHGHHRGHLVRAALEGVCLQLALVLRSMRAAGDDVREIRATGGFARSSLWRQMLTDALGMDVGFAPAREGSSFGAALLGMEALGLIESIGVGAQLTEIVDVLHPDPEAAGVYRSLLPVFDGLYDALMPTFESLRGLDESLAHQRPPETRRTT